MHRRLAGAHLQNHLLAQDTAVLPCSARVLYQLPLTHEERRDILNDLRRYPADAAWEGRCRNTIVSGPRPGATRGEEDIGELAALVVLTDDLGDPDVGAAVGHDAIGDDPGEGAEDRSGEEMADDVTATNWRRKSTVQDAALRRIDLHRAEAPLVIRDMR